MPKGNRGGGKVSAERAEQIRNGIATHTSIENDRAEKSYQSYIKSEKNYVDNLNNYIKLGYIKSANDKWYKDHVENYQNLQAQYKLFKKERKKQGR